MENYFFTDATFTPDTDSSMPVTTQCDQCGKRFENLSDELAGKRLRCKACDHVFRVPASETGVEVMEIPVVSPQPAPTDAASVEPIDGEPARQDEPNAAVPVGQFTPEFKKFRPGAKRSTTQVASPTSVFVDGGVYVGGLLRKLGIQPRRKAILKWVDLAGVIAGVMVTIYGLVYLILSIIGLVRLVFALGEAGRNPAFRPNETLALGVGFAIIMMGLMLALALLYLVAGVMMTATCIGEMTQSKTGRDRWSHRLVIAASLTYLGILFVSFVFGVARGESDVAVAMVVSGLLSIVPIFAICVCVWRFAVDVSEQRLEEDELRYVRSRGQKKL